MLPSAISRVAVWGSCVLEISWEKRAGGSEIKRAYSTFVADPTVFGDSSRYLSGQFARNRKLMPNVNAVELLKNTTWYSSTSLTVARGEQRGWFLALPVGMRLQPEETTLYTE